MNEYPLYIKQEDETFKPSKNLWACGKCNTIKFMYSSEGDAIGSESRAKRCCVNDLCKCGEECDPFYIECKKCREIEKSKRYGDIELKKFEKAKKLSFKDYKFDYIFTQDGDFKMLDDYLDDIDPELMDGDDYVYATKHEYFPPIMIDDFKTWLYESILNDFNDYDYEPTIRVDGLDEIDKALYAFYEANREKYQFISDDDLVITISKSDIVEYQK